MKKLLLFFAFLSAFGPGFSQTYQIGANPALPNMGLPDTVSIGDSVYISVSIRNYGSNNYFGTFLVQLAVDTGTGPVYTGPLDSLTIQINANDSIVLNYPDSIPQGPSPFRIGGNIIVIWPASVNFQALDSAWATIFVMSGSSVGEITGKDNIKVYPNPTSDEITVLQNKGNNSVVRVRIFNSLGKEIAVINNSSIVDLRSLPPGTYLVEAEFSDESRSSFRVVKQKD